MRRAIAGVMPNARALRFLILKRNLTHRAKALGLGLTGAPRHFDIADGSVVADVTGNGEIVDRADGVRVFHFRN